MWLHLDNIIKLRELGIIKLRELEMPGVLQLGYLELLLTTVIIAL